MKKYLESDDFLNDGKCFLCGVQLNQDNSSKEHIIPKWLQKKFDLRDEKLTLLNGTLIEYRKLTVPCCKLCNNEDLSRLDGVIKNAIDKGYQGCIEISHYDWYLWTLKIYLSILRKELSLIADRTGKSIEKILSHDDYNVFRDALLFLQGVRRKHSFLQRKPYSLFIANMHQDEKCPFTIQDSVYHRTMMIRLGDIGIISAFSDCGCSYRKYGWYLKKVAHRKIHPIQFAELYSSIGYTSALMKTMPRYLHIEQTDDPSKKIKTFVMHSDYHFSWDAEEYGEVLLRNIMPWVHIEDGKVDLEGEKYSWMCETDSNDPIIKTSTEWNQILPLGQEKVSRRSP